MTLKDWFKLNPNHTVTLTAAHGELVRATLHGGDGIDQRLVGKGDDEALAIGNALEVRAKLVAELTIVTGAVLPVLKEAL